MTYSKRQVGFTLLEMLLVLVIGSMIIAMVISYSSQRAEAVREQKVVQQMQLLLNAALAYYVQNGTWPSNASSGYHYVDATHDLLKQGYLPVGPGANGLWFNPIMGNVPEINLAYLTGVDPATGNFYVMTTIVASPRSSVTAQIIAGQLPMGVIQSQTALPPLGSSCPLTGSCIVAGGVAIPGQNLNNARSVNYANIYHSGGCVPAPPCPTGMQAEIMAAPVAVSGSNDAGSPAVNVYPISSFTAYALPAPINNTTQLSVPLSANELDSHYTCPTGGNDICDQHQPGITSFNSTFWRVCLAVTTEKGQVDVKSKDGSINMGSILAVTRCVPYKSGEIKEPGGSDIGIW